METTTTPTNPKPNYKCRCGFTTHGLSRGSEDKCPRCYTFSLDHEYNGTNRMDCSICMTHPDSHR